MELLRPLPAGNQDQHAGFRSPLSSSSSRVRVCGEVPAPYLPSCSSSSSSSDHRPEVILEEKQGRVHVALGKSTEKAACLLRWTFRQFPGREVALLHVHRPSSTIPTLLGNLPASQANPEALLAYRREEKEHMKKTICNYLNMCRRAKVQATAIVIEATQVQFGLVDLVVKYSMRTLIMGVASENRLKANSSSKALSTAKNIPPFCEIWFICKGKHVWTREASPIVEPTSQFIDPSRSTKEEKLRSRSLPCEKKIIEFDPRNMGSSSCKSEPSISIRSEACSNKMGTLRLVKKVVESFNSSVLQSSYFSVHTSNSETVSGISCCSSSGLPPASISEEYMELELLSGKIIDAKTEAEKSSCGSLSGLVQFLEQEPNAVEAITEEKETEVAHANKRAIQEAEDTLRKTEMELGKLLKLREEVTGEMQKTRKRVAFLDSQAGDSEQLQSEATEQLSSLQVALADVRRQINSIRKLRDEAMQTVQLWRDSCDFDGITPELNDFSEYTLLDLQTATWNFSEGFKLGQGGHGCVYKGEISGRTVAVKKFHAEDMYSILEFQQEVKVLSKLRHPNLLILLGACPEALCLVYEYLPNGSLQRHLIHSSSATLLTWKIRIQIAAQIASALLFLHSSKPERIVHGDLKPENILLNSDFTCKIGDFGISRLLPEQNAEFRNPFQNTEPKGSFAYMDPEFQRTGHATPASDVYAFGILILQLVTGRPPLGLAKKVRRAAACRKLEEILDASAGEWPMGSTRRMIELGLRCCEVNRRDRLELSSEVVQELERLI